MITIIICAAAPAAICIAPRLLVALLATAIGTALTARSIRVARRVLADSSIRHDRSYDRRPSRAERRLLRKSLRLALDQTELRSLFPSTVACVHQWTKPVR